MNAFRTLDSLSSSVSRREVIRAGAGVAALTGLAALVSPVATAADPALKGRINHSVCRWCYDGYMKKNNQSLEQFAATCKAIGIKSIELLPPADWDAVKKHGLICAMTPSHGITKGLNRSENHDECIKKVRDGIDACAAAGFPNVICFSGNREGLDDETGLKNSVAGLKKVAGYAEEKKVTICLEFLNSKDHKDYMADSTKWCAELVKQVGSPRVKVLYDIYHAAMMDEDPIADIQKHHECWGHYHTGGYPGRAEIDDTQKLDYRKIIEAIAATKFTGYVAQEFKPKREDALASLKQAIAICDV